MQTKNTEYTNAQAKRIIFNFRLFAPKFLKIKTKKGQIVPFKFNSAQLHILEIIERLEAEGKPLRLIILKARQMGISTLMQAYIFHKLLITPNMKCMTLAHEFNASSNLFDMYKRYYDYLPEPMKPSLEASNQKKVKYSKLQSENKIDTAEKGEVGRSDNLQYAHITELAFYRDASNTLVSMLQMCMDAKLVAIESTANGIGGEFYNRWQDAKAGLSDYTPIFLSWLDFPDYKKECDARTKNIIRLSLTDREQRLIEKGASYEQLLWRRRTIKNECGGSEDKFAQEYPSDDMEAFITSGRPVFNVQICKKNFDSAQPPLRIGNLEEVEIDGVKTVEFVENEKGYISIYKEIEFDEYDHYVYVGGCDVAEGLEQGDYSVIPIMDRRDNEIAIVWHGHIDPDLLAYEQWKLQQFLKGDIYFGTERNNHGLTTITQAYKLGVNQYYQEDFEKGGYPESTEKIGWRTDLKTKPIVINQLNEWIREGYFTCNDKGFWAETLTFVRNGRGQMSAQNKDKDSSAKCFDDRVMSMAIMLAVNEWMPSYYRKEPEHIPYFFKKKKQQSEISIMGF